MENQKILWIVFSITLFLLVVVVVGFIWFLPPEATDTADTFAEAGIVSENRSTGFDPIQWIRETESIPGLTDTTQTEGEDEDGDILFVVGAAEEQTGDSAPVERTEPEPSDGGSLTLRVAEPVSSSTTSASTTAPRTVASSSRAESTSQPATTTPKPAQSTPPAPRTVRVTQYWIQVGSFQSRTRAEEAQTELGEKGFSARITSTDVEDDTYFRVRIGPYEAKAEAEKFLGWLKEVDSFGSSYISEVYTTRNVN